MDISAHYTHEHMRGFTRTNAWIFLVGAELKRSEPYKSQVLIAAFRNGDKLF